MILIVWSLKALRENPLKFFDYQFSNSVQDEVNDLLANGVVTSGIVIGSIFFACVAQGGRAGGRCQCEPHLEKENEAATHQ